MSEKLAELGRLVPPYPFPSCANEGCPHADEADHLDRYGAYAYRDLESGKLCVLCGDCARAAELLEPRRFLLVPL